MSEQQTRILSVTELNEYIKAKIETDRLLKNINIKGEISNFTRHSSGHLYFSLKDDTSVIRAVMFKSAAQKMVFSPCKPRRLFWQWDAENARKAL